jgi:hypothetical protein
MERMIEEFQMTVKSIQPAARAGIDGQPAFI